VNELDANKIAMLSYALRHPPKPAPIKQFPMALERQEVDGVIFYFLVLAKADILDPRLTMYQQVNMMTWIKDVLMPWLNTNAGGNVHLSVIGDEINNVNGSAILE
jgi:hypothetical protein